MHAHPADASTRHHRHHASQASSPSPSITRMAFAATLHCLTGCAIGEVLGMVIGTALGWSDLQTIALAVALAFVFGYALTVIPLRHQGMPWPAALELALAADSASIAVMEVVDNAVMWLLPGAMDATLDSALFWGAMAVSLGIALPAAWPVNRWLIARGLGHARVHGHHGADAHHHAG